MRLHGKLGPTQDQEPAAATSIADHAIPCKPQETLTTAKRAAGTVVGASVAGKGVHPLQSQSTQAFVTKMME